MTETVPETNDLIDRLREPIWTEDVMHLYQVKMSKPGAVFIVAAGDEGEAARAAEYQWGKWGYSGGIKAKAVELIGFGGQYPPDTGGVNSDIPWFLTARKDTPDAD